MNAAFQSSDTFESFAALERDVGLFSAIAAEWATLRRDAPPPRRTAKPRCGRRPGCDARRCLGARPSWRQLFEKVRQQMTVPSGGQSAGAELTRVLQRIQGLRAKTVAQDCTEQEALAAAEKAAPQWRKLCSIPSWRVLREDN